ncbi:uncharacterized protein LOC141588626 [Silene latifolia]|uniref:uncharacterized protein LOC141588626 n=1 Tax=Silene latifolia TaxID=37657 RepID=UPI003D77BFD5
MGGMGVEGVGVVVGKIQFKLKSRGVNWKNYSPPTNSAWYWRKICQFKTNLLNAYQLQIWQTQNHQQYTIARDYDYLRVRGAEVSWHKLIWNSWTIPKHAFLDWIYHHGNMNTRDKLLKLGIGEEDTYYICGADTESITHLFLACRYSEIVMSVVGDWIGIVLPLQDVLEWRLARSGSQLQKGVLNATINACFYHIWRQRNFCKHESILHRPHKIARDIIQELQVRLRDATNKKVERNDATWIDRLLGSRP